jgi:hypothetical protein
MNDICSEILAKYKMLNFKPILQPFTSLNIKLLCHLLQTSLSITVLSIYQLNRNCMGCLPLAGSVETHRVTADSCAL